ncbi:DJ-1/PfpI family protein [Nocardioides nanhaiensis]|uniref:DJ-1/PfpI family protein n=1 Tax=Nocardioides nanhaiensis TaxID=1476871 RepID=A0ABP8WVD0_9ACTN
MTRTRVGLLAFETCDAMDLIGPYEVLLTANRLRARAGEPESFEVVVVGEPEVQVYGAMGVRPHVGVADVGELDVLVVPGAIDVEAARPEEAIRELAPRSRVLASVCTGAFFLQRLGLLGDRPVTTHWEDVPLLRDLVADVGASVRDDVRWVDAGTLVTSGGISSGIAMALHLVARFAGHDLAEATARQIDYVWTEQR